ncbi:hypothetical protein GCM10027059_26960 [Myceligenerans halotolerans]
MPQLTSPDTLRALIKQRGLSYSELGASAGCGKSFIGHLVAGRRASASDELAMRLVDALDVPADLLFQPTASGETVDITRSRETTAA